MLGIMATVNNSLDFENTEIDPEEFKVLIFTSGTTSAAKGVMICNRNLAQNINAVSELKKLLDNTDTYLYNRSSERFYVKCVKMIES